MEVFNAEWCAIGLTLDVTIEKRQILQRNVVKMVVVGIDSPAANQQTEHLEPGPGQQTARLIHLRVQALVTHSIKMEIDRLPGHSGISGNHNADCQVNNA